MRVIAPKIPTLADLNLPAALTDIAALKNGIVLVTGPTGSGKSSTLAAIIDLINETRAEHILTIEDPIEFLHLHKKATVHQRELHSDTPTFAAGAARRAAAGAEGDPRRRDARSRDDRDRADRRRNRATSCSRRCTRSTRRRPSSASSARSTPASSTAIRSAAGRVVPLLRLAAAGSEEGRRPRGGARDPEVDDADARVHRCRARREGKTLLDAMRDGALDGMQHFDGELEKLVRAGLITMATAHALRDQRRQPAGRVGRRASRGGADRALTPNFRTSPPWRLVYQGGPASGRRSDEAARDVRMVLRVIVTCIALQPGAAQGQGEEQQPPPEPRRDCRHRLCEVSGVLRARHGISGRLQVLESGRDANEHVLSDEPRFVH